MRTTYWSSVGARPLSRRRLLKGSAVAGVGLAGVGLVGCGDDDDDPEPTATASTGGQTPVASPTTAVKVPVQGGTYRERSAAGISAFEPYSNLSYSAQQHWGFMSNRVLRFAYGPEYSPNDNTLAPDIASAMPEQPDPLTIVVPIREGVKFHNVPPANGRAMTAEDVAWSMNRYKAIGQRKSDYDIYESIEATDDKTVTIKLKRVTASGINTLGDNKLMWVLAKEAATDAAMSNQSPFLGVGPFIWEKYEPDVLIAMNRNPDYWEGDGKPYFDRVEIAIIPQEATYDAQFRAGQITQITVPEKDRYADLQKVDGVQELTYATISGQWKEFSFDKPPFDNPMVRQALSMAIDRDEHPTARGSIDYGWHTQLWGVGYTPWFIDPKSSDFGENAKYYEYNPTEAKAMLGAAGFTDSSPLEFTHHYTNEYAGEQIAAELMVDQFSRIGVKLNLEQTPYTEWQQKYKVATGAGWRNWDGIMGNRPANFADPTASMNTYWLMGDASRGMQAGKDPDLVTMSAEQDAELDNEARIEKFHEIQRYLGGKQYALTLHSEYDATLWQKDVRNMYPRLNLGRGSEMVAQLWMDKA